MLKDDLKSLVWIPWDLWTHTENSSSTETQLLLLISLRNKPEVAGWAVGSLMRASAVGLWDSQTSFPSPSQCSREIHLCISASLKEAGICSLGYSGMSSAPGIGSTVGWVLTRLSVCVTALGLLRGHPCLLLLTDTHCLPHTEECASKPVPCKNELKVFQALCHW